jgi:hypothetical protein
MDKEILLNNFAIRSFRDVADNDYICARMAARATLISQFLWLSLQAIEKYLKCILLLNRIPAKKIGHNLGSGLALIRKNAPFEIRLSKGSEDLIEHLDTYGRFRYLETSHFVQGLELPLVDRTVWEIRRYCTVINYSIKLDDGSTKEMLQLEIEKIINSENNPRHHFKVFGGLLEKIVDDKKDPAREPLVWQNHCFGRQARKSIRIVPFFHATNSPLSLHPEILDNVLKYVFLPDKVIEAYRIQSGSRGFFSPSPHTTRHAGPHRAVR